MKNIHDVLRQKELEFQQIQREIEALRLVVRLLTDDGEVQASAVGSSLASTAGPRPAAVVAKPADGSFGVPPAGIRQFP
jgi:hypothetical protein